MRQGGIVGSLCRNAFRCAPLCAAVACLLAVGAAPPKSHAPAAPGLRPAVMPMRRIVLLHLPPPESGQASVQRWIAAARAQNARNRRQGKSSPNAPSDGEPRSAGGRQKPAGTRVRKAEEADAAQLRAIGDALLADDLAERLHAQLRIATVPAAEVMAAEAVLRLSPEEALRPENAGRLCAAVGAEALLTFSIRNVAVQEAADRAAALWAEIRLLYRRKAASDDAPPDGFAPALPAAFPVSGAGSVGHKLFRSGYVKSRTDVLSEAVHRAAAQAVFMLRTGAVAPFAREGERIAVPPILAPTRTDKLLFTGTGRIVLPAAARDLPADVSASFEPDLLPLFGEAVVGPTEMQLILGEETETLWLPQGEGMPDPARVQQFGRRLHVDYVLLARITDIELESGPPEDSQWLPSPTLPPRTGARNAGADTPLSLRSGGPAKQSPLSLRRRGAGGEVAAEDQETEARAEAVGALVRVADGALLWHDRATAAMSAHPYRSGIPMPSDRQIVGQAERFALLQLQRLWRGYRASFER